MQSSQDESDILNIHASSKHVIRSQWKGRFTALDTAQSTTNTAQSTVVVSQYPHTSFSYNQNYQICFRECIYQQWEALCWFLVLHCLAKKKSRSSRRLYRTQSGKIDWLMIAYIALFSALLSRLTALVCGSAWVTSFYSAFFEYQTKWCTYSAGMADSTWNCSRLGASPVCTMSLHAKPHT